MPDGSIRIIVSAVADRSTETVFATIEKRAEKMGRNVARSLGGGNANSLGRSFESVGRSADKSAREAEAAWKRELASLNKIAREQDRIWANAAKNRVKAEKDAAREIERTERERTRETARALQQTINDEERAAKKIEQSRQRFASRTSHRAVRFLFPNPIGAFGMASRIGGDILRGAGVDFSVAGSVSRAVGVQSLATHLSNQGYMPQEHGPNGTRVANTVLAAEARANAKGLAYDPEQMLRAQTKFVDLTGNLNDARDAMPKIAALSRATNTDPEKMAEAWANVSRHMGDIPNKAEKVEGLMRMIAGQGRVGSIEIKDEAKDLGKIAAMADKFGGDRGETIGKLTTLAQLAKAEGGAASSAQAATSIVSFAGTFDKGARLKKLFSLGLKEDDIFNMTGTGKGAVRSSIKDPFEIIKKTLEKTGGDMTKFASAFQSVMSQRATNALVAAYNSKGGHNMAAVDQKLAEFGKEATLTPEQIKENNEEYMKTTEAKAKVFQDNLDEIVTKIAGDVLPAFDKLGPKILWVAEKFTDFVSWFAENPWKGVGVLVAGAIGRSLLEAGFREIIERAILRGAGGGGGGAGAGAGGGALGGGTGLAVGAAVAGVVVAGQQTNTLARSVGSKKNAWDMLSGFRNGEFSTDALFEDLLHPIEAIKRKGKVLGDIGGHVIAEDYQLHKFGPGGGVAHANTPQEYDKMMANAANVKSQGGVDHAVFARAVTEGLRGSGPLQVTVTNMPASGLPPPPGASSDGRAPPAGAPPPGPRHFKQ